jgi:hypothetical protein
MNQAEIRQLVKLNDGMLAERQRLIAENAMLLRRAWAAPARKQPKTGDSP